MTPTWLTRSQSCQANVGGSRYWTSREEHSVANRFNVSCGQTDPLLRTLLRAVKAVHADRGDFMHRCASVYRRADPTGQFADSGLYRLCPLKGRQHFMIMMIKVKSFRAAPTIMHD